MFKAIKGFNEGARSVKTAQFDKIPPQNEKDFTLADIKLRVFASKTMT
jgi:hypothetical protein